MIPTKFWRDSIPDMQSFHYEFKININPQNWSAQLFAFDSYFLEIGRKYQLFYYKNIGLDIYDPSTIRSCYTVDDNQISLLMFQKRLWEHQHSWFDAYIDLPELQGNQVLLTPTCYHQPFQNLEILRFDLSDGCVFADAFLKGEAAESELTLTLSSQSNIWWQEIGFTVGSADSTRLLLNPPIDNRLFAKAITPRFNSFLRDLSKKTIALGGSVQLVGERDSKYVTEKGILLDDVIQYWKPKLRKKSTKP
jgi:hypothetical protein